METDLGSVLKSKQHINLQQVEVIFYQILCGLQHIHATGVIHRDLKPRNILLNSNCDVKICDFGLSTFDISGCEHKTDYICTRWYRAPEILLGYHQYDSKVDVFSAGCVLAEIIARQPLLPGSCAANQLQLTVERLGTIPGNDDIVFTPNQGNLGEYLKESGSELVTEDGIDLVRILCMTDPTTRPSVDAAMQHAWFDRLRSVLHEPRGSRVAQRIYPLRIDEKINIRELVRKEVASVNLRLGKTIMDGDVDIRASTRQSTGDDTPSTGCSFFKLT